MRKKKSEMTPVELIDQALKGRSWDEAETAGIEILARCMALHVYARNEEDYVENLFRRICERYSQWVHESGHPFVLAMASEGQKLKHIIEHQQ